MSTYREKSTCSRISRKWDGKTKQLTRVGIGGRGEKEDHRDGALHTHTHTHDCSCPSCFCCNRPTIPLNVSLQYYTYVSSHVPASLHVLWNSCFKKCNILHCWPHDDEIDTCMPACLTRTRRKNTNNKNNSKFIFLRISDPHFPFKSV